MNKNSTSHQTFISLGDVGEHSSQKMICLDPNPFELECSKLIICCKERSLSSGAPQGFLGPLTNLYSGPKFILVKCATLSSSANCFTQSGNHAFFKMITTNNSIKHVFVTLE